MASTTFVDGETLIEATWLNDVNAVVYTPGTTTAADIANVPAGSITATDVQAAINELDTEKQPLDAELTALATSTAAANKIPYFTGTTTASTLDYSIDGTFASNVDTKIPSEKAIKTYIGSTSVALTGDQTIAGTKTFSSTPVLPAQSMVRLNTANGLGSTNTAIRRFTNTVTNQGTDITYADSATLGASFTINTNGVYAISFNDQFNVNAPMGISLNSTQLTTSIQNITQADILCQSYTSAANIAALTSCTVALVAGDVIRPHVVASVTAGASTTMVQFTITRVS